MSTTLPAAPAILIGEKGKPNFGNFAGPIPELNFDAFDYRAVRRWPWNITQSLGKKLLKRWQFVGVIDENYVLGAAVVNAQYVGTGFAYAFDRRTGRIVEKNLKSPLAGGTTFSPSAATGESEIRIGKKRIHFANEPREGRREATLEFGQDLAASFSYRESGVGVTTVCRQVLYGFGLTYKIVGCPATGEITVGGERYTLSENAVALLDWSAAIAPRETVWNWAAAAGTDKSGRPVGINFSTGLVEAAFTENTVWVDGRPIMFGGMVFAYNQKDITGQPWRVHTPDGAVDLTFQPEHERYEKINFGLVASSLHQPFGRFTGRIQAEGETLDVSLYGFCEEHYAKW